MKSETKLFLALFGIFITIASFMLVSYYNTDLQKTTKQKTDFCFTRCASLGAEDSTYLNKGAELYCACKKENSIIISNVFEKNYSLTPNFTPEELRLLLQW